MSYPHINTFDIETADFCPQQSRHKDLDGRSLLARYYKSPGKAVEIVVKFRKGGINYFTYKEEPKGYYVTVRAVEIKGGLLSYSYGMGTGAFLEEAKRFSRKTLAGMPKKHAKTITDLVTEYVEQLD